MLVAVVGRLHPDFPQCNADERPNNSFDKETDHAHFHFALHLY